MKFTILQLWHPNIITGAIDCLVGFAFQSPEQAKNIVDVVRHGIPTQVVTINDVDANDMSHLRQYFKIALPEKSPVVQLKLWEVSFIRYNPRMAGSGMVLAETREVAEDTIKNAVQTFDKVTASEIVGPFDNGWILTTTITLK